MADGERRCNHRAEKSPIAVDDGEGAAFQLAPAASANRRGLQYATCGRLTDDATVQALRQARPGAPRLECMPVCVVISHPISPFSTAGKAAFLPQSTLPYHSCLSKIARGGRTRERERTSARVRQEEQGKRTARRCIQQQRYHASHRAFQWILFFQSMLVQLLDLADNAFSDRSLEGLQLVNRLLANKSPSMRHIHREWHIVCRS